MLDGSPCPSDIAARWKLVGNSFAARCGVNAWSERSWLNRLERNGKRKTINLRNYIAFAPIWLIAARSLACLLIVELDVNWTYMRWFTDSCASLFPFLQHHFSFSSSRDCSVHEPVHKSKTMDCDVHLASCASICFIIVSWKWKAKVICFWIGEKLRNNSWLAVNDTRCV